MLDPSKLAQGLKSALTNPSPSDFVDAGRKWANAYADYASDAESLGGGGPVGLDIAQNLLAATLAATFAVSLDPVSTASQMASALTALWLAPPVVFGTGLVTAVGGTSILAAGLPAVFVANSVGQLTADQSYQALAGLIHAFTITVITTTPPAPTIGPIF